jgi:hypothetical protein
LEAEAWPAPGRIRRIRAQYNHLQYVVGIIARPHSVAERDEFEPGARRPIPASSVSPSEPTGIAATNGPENDWLDAAERTMFGLAQ